MPSEIGIAGTTVDCDRLIEVFRAAQALVRQQQCIPALAFGLQECSDPTCTRCELSRAVNASDSATSMP